MLILLVMLPGVLSLLLMVCSWAIVRNRTTVFAALFTLIILFTLQFVTSLRVPQPIARAVGVAFSAGLLFFAIFGVVYAEYADFAGVDVFFSTDRLGEAFFLATTLGTGTGFAPDVQPDMGLLVIAHTQLVLLALSVAVAAASAWGRMTAQRMRGRRIMETNDTEFPRVEAESAGYSDLARK